MGKNLEMLAYKFLTTGTKQKITKLPVDFDTLFELAGQKGWLISTYQAGRNLIKKLGYEDAVAKRKSFTVQSSDNTKIIFYKDGVSMSEKVFLIAHEIGHIILAHTSSGVLGESPDPAEEQRQETEADNFAYALLAPPIVLRACHIKSANEIERVTLMEREDAEVVLSKILTAEDAATEVETAILEQFGGFIENFRRNKRTYLFKNLVYKPSFYVSCLMLIFIMFGVSFVGNYLPAAPTSTPTTTSGGTETPLELQEPTGQISEQQPTTLPEQTAETGAVVPVPENDYTVYVTKTGNAYHKATCFHLKNRQYSSILRSVAIADGKEACLDCNPG